MDCGWTSGATAKGNFKGEEHMYFLHTLPDMTDQRAVKFPQRPADDTFRAREAVCAAKMHSMMQTNHQTAVKCWYPQNRERLLHSREGRQAGPQP